MIVEASFLFAWLNFVPNKIMSELTFLLVLKDITILLPAASNTHLYFKSMSNQEDFPNRTLFLKCMSEVPKMNLRRILKNECMGGQ